MPPRARDQQGDSPELREPLLGDSSSSSTGDGLAVPQSTIREQLRGDAERQSASPTSPSQDDDDEQTNNSNNNNSNSAASRNVRLTLIYTIIAFAGRSIWSQSVLATYIFLIKNGSAEAVGYITAVQGICQLAASFPAGYLADVYRRDTLLRVAAGLGVAAVLTTVAACRAEQYRWLTVALAAWGLCYGVANTTLTALFADSIPDGQRSHFFTKRSILVTLGNTAGPLTALVLFEVLGDHWTVHDCTLVMSIGQAVCFPAVLLLCFFRDSTPAVQREDSGEQEQTHSGTSADGKHNGSSADCTEAEERQQSASFLEQPLLCGNEQFVGDGNSNNNDDDNDHTEDDCSSASSSSSTSSSSSSSSTINVLCNGCGLPKHRVIPILICISDVISGIGSGCSIRYFPLFFVDHLHLGPVAVQVLYICAPLMQTVLMKISQRLAKTHGRCHVTVLFKWIGITLMFSMILAYKATQNVVLVGVLFVLRTGFMNSCSALTRSMLMDNVPSHERGKWSALESVNMFCWSGSAALGGVLVGLFGIVRLFAITAVIQLVSSLVVMMLFGVDARG